MSRSLARDLLLTQVGVLLPAPAFWTALQDMTMMQQQIEHGGDRQAHSREHRRSESVRVRAAATILNTAVRVETDELAACAQDLGGW